MATRRGGSPDFNDMDRFTENLHLQTDVNIIDRSSYILAATNYISKTRTVTSSIKNGIIDKSFPVYATKFPSTDRRNLHKKAKGKDLRQDRLKTSENVVTDKKDFKDARKQDLSGLDTKKGVKITKKRATVLRQRKFLFRFKGRSGSKVVKARKVFVRSRGKDRIRFRDKNGRFVSVKKQT